MVSSRVLSGMGQVSSWSRDSNGILLFSWMMGC